MNKITHFSHTNSSYVVRPGHVGTWEGAAVSRSGGIKVTENKGKM